ncbi:MAG: hypothetical protein KKH28_06515 [Elusimicrobia bacterium]|nr:hypothetical protein [Elusimicrobiota bacterium]
MKYKSEVFEKQFPIVKDFLFHIVYYRELNRVYKQYESKSVFWAYTINAHILQATILWCMVFGSDSCNPTHWRHLSIEECEKLKSGFRQGLLETTKLKIENLYEYWKTIDAFRNKYVAHRELTFSDTVPIFDLAIDYAYFYDSWIRKIIAPVLFDEPPLKKFVEKLEKEVRHFIPQLFLIDGVLKPIP